MTGFKTYGPNTAPEEVHETLMRDGCVVVEGVFRREDLDALKAQCQPHFAARAGDQSGNDFMGAKTIRFGRLLYRIPKVREIIRNPVLFGQAERMLLPVSPKVRASFTGVMYLQEGQQAQVLHRDNTPFENQAPPVVCATMTAVEDFRRENGATVLVPGSHLWPEEREPVREELVAAEMPAGSVLFYAGNLIHGGGRCRTGSRFGLSLQYSVSWMAYDEMMCAMTHEELDIAATLDEDLLKLMGYDMAARNWGSADDVHPLDYLLKDGKNRTQDAPGYELSNGTVRSLWLRTSLKPRLANHHYHVTLDDAA